MLISVKTLLLFNPFLTLINMIINKMITTILTHFNCLHFQRYKLNKCFGYNPPFYAGLCFEIAGLQFIGDLPSEKRGIP